MATSSVCSSPPPDGGRRVRDELQRGRDGRRHCIYQSSDDVNHLVVSLEFSSGEAADTFRKALQPVWDVSGAGQAWVLQEAEAATY